MTFGAQPINMRYAVESAKEKTPAFPRQPVPAWDALMSLRAAN